MSFYVYLFSNSPNRSHEHENEIFHFITELSRPIELKGDWEVGLVEFSYPKLTKTDNQFFFIYTDIVEYTFVGSKQYEILRPVQLSNTDNNQLVNLDTYQNCYYLPVTKEIIKSIEIQIDSDLYLDPRDFSLNCGDVILVLHFRKRS